MLVEPTQALPWIPFDLKQEGDCCNCSNLLAHFKICRVGGGNKDVNIPGNIVL